VSCPDKGATLPPIPKGFGKQSVLAFVFSDGTVSVVQVDIVEHLAGDPGKGIAPGDPPLVHALHLAQAARNGLVGIFAPDGVAEPAKADQKVDLRRGISPRKPWRHPMKKRVSVRFGPLL
jgi:hypothetical protein